MPEFERPDTTLGLELLQHTVSHVKSYEIDSTYMTSTDGFSFEAFMDEKLQNQLGRLELQPIVIEVNGAQQLLGRIERSSIGGNGTAIQLSGRDYISDLVECNIDPIVKIKSSMTVTDAIKFVAGPVGIVNVENGSGIALRNVRSGKHLGGGAGKDFKALKMEELKSTPGQGIYEFCNKIVARHGGTLQPATTRDTVAIDEPDYTSQPVGHIRRTAATSGSVGNNVLSATATRDFTRFPTVALFTGKQAKGGKTASGLSKLFDFVTLARAFGTELGAVIDRVHELSGEQARRKPGSPPGLARGQLYRLLYHRDETSRNLEQLERAARRAIAERLKDTLSYSVTLRGHSDPETGAIWSPNTMVEVQDTITGVNETLWIEKRTLRYSEGSGATTQIEAWRPESFQIG